MRQNVYMTHLWEVETTILAEVIGMPKPAVDAEIEKHRQICDFKGSLQEVRELTDPQRQWQLYVEEKQRQQHEKMMKGGEKRMTIFSMSTARASVFRRPTAAPRPSIALTLMVPKDAIQIGSPRTRRGGHPLMDVIEKYRLSQEQRDDVVHTMLRENVERWWTRYQEYKEQQRSFKIAMEAWFLEIAALGPHNRNDWPSVPAPPRCPSELMKIDDKWLRSQVLKELRQTQAGQLL